MKLNMPVPEFGRTQELTSRYVGGTWAVKLVPRSVVQRPMPVSEAERFIKRRENQCRRFGPAVPAVVLPSSSRWVFERGDRALRVGLCAPPAETASGYVGLIHDAGNLFVDRLRNRPWVPQPSGPGKLPFAAIRPNELVLNDALAGEQMVEHRCLILLLASDVLCTDRNTADDAICRWFAIEWPEDDLEEAVRDLQDRTSINGALVTDRMTTTISSELLATSDHRQFTIPASEDLPADQAFKILSVSHGGQRMRSADELGDWNAMQYWVEPISHLSGEVARLHWSIPVANVVIKVVRFPSQRFPEPAATDRELAESACDDGLVAGAEILGPVQELFRQRRWMHRQEALARALPRYPRYGLDRLMIDLPECDGVVLWPSARLGAGAADERPHPQGTGPLRRDLDELGLDLDKFLAFHLPGECLHRCHVEEATNVS